MTRTVPAPAGEASPVVRSNTGGHDIRRCGSQAHVNRATEPDTDARVQRAPEQTALTGVGTTWAGDDSFVRFTPGAMVWATSGVSPGYQGMTMFDGDPVQHIPVSPGFREGTVSMTGQVNWMIDNMFQNDEGEAQVRLTAHARVENGQVLLENPVQSIEGGGDNAKVESSVDIKGNFISMNPRWVSEQQKSIGAEVSAGASAGVKGGEVEVGGSFSKQTTRTNNRVVSKTYGLYVDIPESAKPAPTMGETVSVLQKARLTLPYLKDSEKLDEGGLAVLFRQIEKMQNEGADLRDSNATKAIVTVHLPLLGDLRENMAMSERRRTDLIAVLNQIAPGMPVSSAGLARDGEGDGGSISVDFEYKSVPVPAEPPTIPAAAE